MTEQVSARILELCSQVTAKRARTVIDHLLKHGTITTEELKNLYGYDHPPRAIRDVREHGIPIETFTVTSTTTNRKIAAYRFGDPDKIRQGRIGGRQAFSKRFKNTLVEMFDSKSTLTGERLDPRYLQIDHRIPYEVAGNDADLTNPAEFMLLDASSQRAKSWSCEHCDNFLKLHDPAICAQCFWAYPESYSHVAMTEERRLYLVWQGNEIADYDALQQEADKRGLSVNEYVKRLIQSNNS